MGVFNKKTGEFFAPKTLRDKLGGLNTMKNFSGIDETPPALEKSLKAATKPGDELPTDIEMESIPPKELSSLAEDIHVKTREASQNTNLDIREFLGIDKALQSIQGELLNNTLKLTEINKSIKRDTKRLEEVENNPIYFDEQRQLYRDRLDNLNTEKQARLEILSNIGRNSKHSLQGSSKPLKKFLVKIYLWQKEFEPYLKKKVLPYFQY